jgi:hypothetical protein
MLTHEGASLARGFVCVCDTLAMIVVEQTMTWLFRIE